MTWDLIIFDLDGVLLDVYSSWVWVHQHYQTSNDDSLRAYERGEIDDREFMRRDIALWLAKEPVITSAQIRKILTGAPLMPGLAALVGHLKHTGSKLVIVSGGLDLVAEQIATRFGFDRWIANGLEVDDEDRLTGEGILRVPLRDKGTPARAFIDEFGAVPDRCVAIGNSHIDVQMFDVCGLGIAFAPIDDRVRAGADIVIADHDLRKIIPVLNGHPRTHTHERDAAQ